MALRIIYVMDEFGTWWAFERLVLEEGIEFEFAPSDCADLEELPA